MAPIVYSTALEEADPPYTAIILPFGDSITLGSAESSALLASYREPLFNTANGGGYPHIWFIGTQSFAGYGGGLTADPYCAGYSGYTIRNAGGLSAGSLIAQTPTEMAHHPDVAIMLGGTNDIAVLGDSPSAVAASWSTWLDDVWALRPHDRFQIVVGTILKRLDGFNPAVIATNALLPAIAAGKAYAGNISVAPIYDCIVNQTTSGPAPGYADNIHPADPGYVNMAATWWTALEPVLPAAVGA